MSREWQKDKQEKEMNKEWTGNTHTLMCTNTHRQS